VPSNQLSGSQNLWRSDLHAYTPFDKKKNLGQDIRGAIEAFKKQEAERLVAVAERFIEACDAAADGEACP